MKKMKIYILKISRLCRLRRILYESDILSQDGAISVTETLDEEIRKNIIDMKDNLSINDDNVELFLSFFWDLLEEDEIWQSSSEDYGKDWEFTKEMLSEMLREL